MSQDLKMQITWDRVQGEGKKVFLDLHVFKLHAHSMAKLPNLGILP